MGAKFRGHGGPCLEVGERLDKERGGGKNFGVNEAFVGGVVDTRLRYENKAAKIQLSLGLVGFGGDFFPTALKQKSNRKAC